MKNEHRKNRAYRLLLAAIPVILLLASGCDPRVKKAYGDRNQVVVFSDLANWAYYGERLKQILEREVETPRSELIFNVRNESFDKWDFFSRYNHLIICAALSEDTPTGDRVREMLSADVQRQIYEEGGGRTIPVQDPFAVGQQLVILTADTMEHLREYLDSNPEHIFRIVEEQLNKLTSTLIYRENEQFALEDSLLTDYGFTVRVPWGFRMVRDFEEQRFIRMIKYQIERWFFAYWIPVEDLDGLDLAWVHTVKDMGERIARNEVIDLVQMDFLADKAMDLRDYICRLYYDRDYVVREFTTATVVEFNGRWAVRLYGRWQNDESSAGGPIVSYCLIDPGTDRLYWLDGAIYAPNVKKEPQLRQMDVMIQTLMTGPEAREYVNSIQEYISGRRR